MLEYILNGYEYNIVHYMFRMSTLKKKQFAARVSKNLSWSDGSDDSEDDYNIDDTRYLVSYILLAIWILTEDICERYICNPKPYPENRVSLNTPIVVQLHSILDQRGQFIQHGQVESFYYQC